VEATVIEFDSIADSSVVLVNDKFVVQPKLAFWRSGQISPHLDMSVHIRAKNVACIRTCEVSGVDSFINLPFALMLRLTFSITSTKASFFLYRTSARLQLIAPVAWDVILEDSSYKKH